MYTHSPNSAILALVDQILEVKRKRNSGKLAPSELERIECEIATIEARIDECVCRLYEIAADERKVIEGYSE